MSSSATESFNYSHDGHEVNILKQFNRQRDNEELCDVTLVVGAKRFIGHRALLSAASPYFHAMFTGGMLETQKESVDIKGIAANIFKLLLDFIYSGQITITDTICQDVMAAAGMLQLPGAINACCTFLTQQLHPSNAIETIKIHRGATSMQLSILDVLTLEDIRTVFSETTGLIYKDAGSDPCIMLIRDGKFVKPVDGWSKEGRIYEVQEKVSSQPTCSSTVTTTSNDSPSSVAAKLIKKLQKKGSLASPSTATSISSISTAQMFPELSIEIPMKLVDSNGALLRSTAKRAVFTGYETFEETFEIAKTNFPTVEIDYMKLGAMHGPVTSTFGKCGTLRVYMRKHQLRPSHVTMYLLSKEGAKSLEKRKASAMRKHVKRLKQETGTRNRSSLQADSEQDSEREELTENECDLQIKTEIDDKDFPKLEEISDYQF